MADRIWLPSSVFIHHFKWNIFSFWTVGLKHVPMDINIMYTVKKEVDF